jgi:hypothetical protein
VEPVEADWRRSKERGETERGELNQNCKLQRRDQVSEIENPKIKTQKVFRPDYSYRPEQAGTGRNGAKWAKRAGILAEVEQGGDSYRFVYRYEIFIIQHCLEG